MTDWQIVIPHVMPRWNLEQCLASMGTPPVPLLIVDNSPTSDTRTMTIPDNTEVVWHPDNLGVAASWNLGLRRGAKWTLIVSASIRFEAGGIARMLEAVAPLANEYGLELGSWDRRADGPWNVGWKCIIIGRALVDRIGEFDENLYPAYIEDRDYGHRARLAFGAIPWLKGGVEVAGVTKIGDAVAWKHGAMGPNPPTQWNWEYYREKWGVVGDTETYVTPFNDPSVGLDYWPDPTARIQRWRLR